MTSYLMAIVMFALHITIYKIFTNEIKGKMYDTENERYGQGLKWDLQ